MDVLRRKYAFLFKYKVFFPNHFFSELMQITCFNITYSVTLDNVNILKFHTQFSRFSYSWLGSWDSSWILLYCSTTRIWVTIANTDFCEYYTKSIMLSNRFCLFDMFIIRSGEGIASYAGQPGAAGQSLEACLDHAVKSIPKDKHQLTPVYLGATAGMRLLQ